MSRRFVTLSLTLCLIVVGLSGFLSSCQKQELVLGVIAPLTGSKADQGKQFKEGVELRVKEINAAGGLPGRQIKVELLDDKGQPADAASCAQKLAATKNIFAVIGPSSTASCSAAVPILEAAKIIGISPSASTPTLVTDHKYFYILSQPNTIVGGLPVPFAVEHFAVKKIAILQVKDDWGIACTDSQKVQADRLGVEITSTALYNQGDRDFKAQLTSLMATKPDAIMFNTHYTEGALAARQGREMGIEIPFIGQGTNVYPEFLEIYGMDSGFIAMTAFMSTLDDPETKAAVAKFQPAIGVAPDVYHINAYDAVSVLAEAVKKVGNVTDTDKLTQAIAAMKNVDGIGGDWGFDENRLVDKPRYFVEVKDGKWVVIK